MRLFVVRSELDRDVAAADDRLQRRCRNGDDDEDCDDDGDVVGSSGAAAAGDFLLLHNDARVPSAAHPASTSTPSAPSLTPSNLSAAGHKPPTSAAVPPRGVASKRSGTDSDDSRDAGGVAGGGAADNAPVTAASSTNSRLAVHIGLIAGSSVGVVVVLLLAALAVYKYRSRDQGSYRLDPDVPNGYVAGPGAGERFRLRRTSSSGLASSGPADQNTTMYRLRNSSRNSRSKGRRDVKEWYV